MTIKLYGHPFAAFVWKPLIAAYERGVPFEFCMIDADHPEHRARIAELSPTGQFPALVHGAREITQSIPVIEYLDRIGDAAPMVPRDPDAALTTRILAGVFDDYVAGPMQQVVTEALRPADRRDPRRVQDAKARLDQAYAWLARRIGHGRGRRRPVQHRGLRGGPGLVLRRLGAPHRRRPAQGLPVTPAGAPVRGAGGGRGASQLPAVSAGCPGQGLNRPGPSGKLSFTHPRSTS